MTLDFSKLKILVVEDVKPMRKLLASVLESMGVGMIFEAENGEQGFEIAKRENPDIIVTDWYMDPVDGIELTNEIRTNMMSANRMVPVILMTGFSAAERAAKARDAGVTEFLVKPFSANDLAQRLNYVISMPRDFIDAPGFFGPDRRRKQPADYPGPYRRETDSAA